MVAMIDIALSVIMRLHLVVMIAGTKLGVLDLHCQVMYTQLLFVSFTQSA